MAAAFVGAFLADLAYLRSYQVQWNNFSAWLNMGGDVLATIALLCAIVDVARPERRGRRQIAMLAVLLATWLIGVLDGFANSRDAFGSMPDAGGLSMAAAVFALAAVWLEIAGLRRRAVP